jgi:hypothetical protein
MLEYTIFEEDEPFDYMIWIDAPVSKRRSLAW